MYDGVVSRNDDGSYSSSAGHQLTKGPDGQLYSGGAPIGVSAGIGGGVVPTAWTSRETASSSGAARVPGGFSWLPGGVVDGPSHDLSLLAVPIYGWMVFLGVLAGIAISGSPSVASKGLHWHPVYGVAATVLVIGGYRYLMTVFPTALVVSLASSLCWATGVWVWRHPAEANAVSAPVHLQDVFTFVTALAMHALDSTMRTPDVWVVATGAVGVALHLFYWRHRRRMATRVGWLFDRGVVKAAKTLIMLAAASGAVGMLIGWLG